MRDHRVKKKNVQGTYIGSYPLSGAGEYFAVFLRRTADGWKYYEKYKMYIRNDQLTPKVKSLWFAHKDFTQIRLDLLRGDFIPHGRGMYPTRAALLQKKRWWDTPEILSDAASNERRHAGARACS